MDLAVSEVVGQASWKLTTILWARRLHDVPQLVQVYTSKVPSFVEYRTPAVYHAAKTTLPGIDAVQKRFLRECGLSDEDALLHLNLAPLETRRDIAMLGLLHHRFSESAPGKTSVAAMQQELQTLLKFCVCCERRRQLVSHLLRHVSLWQSTRCTFFLRLRFASLLVDALQSLVVW